MGNQIVRQTQKNFDPIRYQGRWYEIARYPNPFEQDCYSAIAEYKWNSDMNYLEITNICLNEKLKYKRQRHAIARIKDPNNKSILSLKFIDGLFKSPESDYIVFSTDYDNYSIVGNFEGNYLWVLSRKSTFLKDDVRYIKKFVEKFGFNSDRLVFPDKRFE